MTDHRWSSGAACVGVLVALLLTISGDNPLNAAIGLLCPPVVILPGILQLVHINDLPVLGILLFTAAAAAGNAIWYMLIAETARLAFVKFRHRISKGYARPWS